MNSGVVKKQWVYFLGRAYAQGTEYRCDIQYTE